MLQVGKPAPDFTLPGSRGQTVTLSKRTHRYAVLVFYPKNNTPGWNRQLAALEADRQRFDALDAEILAINPASVEAHDRYCDSKGFGFTILSDDGRKVAKQYEAIKFPGLLIQRTVYVVGPQGTIIFSEEGMPADQTMLDAIAGDRKP